GAQLERYCVYYLRWRQREAHLARHGLTYPAKSDDPTYYAIRLPGGPTAVIRFQECPAAKESHRLHQALAAIQAQFGPTPAGQAVGFFDFLQLADGDFDGRPFKLEPCQQFIVGSLFGWKGPDGVRRFRTAYCEIGKGNGKTPLAAGVGLKGLVADEEAGAEV